MRTRADLADVAVLALLLGVLEGGEPGSRSFKVGLGLPGVFRPLVEGGLQFDEATPRWIRH